MSDVSVPNYDADGICIASYSCDGARGEQTLSVFVDNGEPSCETRAEITVECLE